MFAKVADAVVFLIVQDDKGNTLGQGSRFVFGSGLVVTNAHVVGSGRVFIRSGAFNIPCTLEKLDATNDLAILRPSADLAIASLIPAEKVPPNGTMVFALGNPKGLQQTISQGLITGLRIVDGREMLQISAPISPGSSGGPVVLATGELVGVAAGSFRDGQNLNFAVPIAAVQRLLAPTRAADNLFESLMAQLADIRIARKRFKFSADSDSDWQKSWKGEGDLLRKALPAAGNSSERLLRVAREAVSAETEVRVTAARQAYAATQAGPEAVRLLAAALQSQSIGQDGDSRAASLREAEAIASKVDGARATIEDLLLLADIQGDQAGRQGFASKTAQRALALGADSTQQSRLYRILFAASRSQKVLKEGLAWFTKLVETGESNDFDTQALAEFLDDAKQFRDAATVYSGLAAKKDLFLFDGRHDLWCKAALNSWKAEELDDALESARRCLSAAALEKGGETRAAQAHNIIGSILVGRDVFGPALEHAREAVKIEPESYLAYYLMAQSFHGLERFSEAEAAAKRSLALSDGRTVTFSLC